VSGSKIPAPGADRNAAAFRPFDADLASYVLLDFDAFDAWYSTNGRLG
jgi:hypothetical protein